MRPILKRTAFVAAIFASGLALGVYGTVRIVIGQGERWGSRIIKLGVIVSNAGDPDLRWTVAVDREPPPAPVSPPAVVRVAAKGKK
jgi:hypothetical protein